MTSFRANFPFRSSRSFCSDTNWHLEKSNPEVVTLVALRKRQYPSSEKSSCLGYAFPLSPSIIRSGASPSVTSCHLPFISPSLRDSAESSSQAPSTCSFPSFFPCQFRLNLRHCPQPTSEISDTNRETDCFTFPTSIYSLSSCCSVRHANVTGVVFSLRHRDVINLCKGPLHNCPG